MKRIDKKNIVVKNTVLSDYFQALQKGNIQQEKQMSSIEKSTVHVKMCNDAYDGDGNTDPDDPFGHGWIRPTQKSNK